MAVGDRLTCHVAGVHPDIETLYSRIFTEQTLSHDTQQVKHGSILHRADIEELRAMAERNDQRMTG